MSLTIDEAIEILEDSYYKHTILLAGKDDEALKLALEALSRIAYLRKDMDCPHWMWLPGEKEK